VRLNRALPPDAVVVAKQEPTGEGLVLHEWIVRDDLLDERCDASRIPALAPEIDHISVAGG